MFEADLFLDPLCPARAATPSWNSCGTELWGVPLYGMMSPLDEWLSSESSQTILAPALSKTDAGFVLWRCTVGPVDPPNE